MSRGEDGVTFDISLFNGEACGSLRALLIHRLSVRRLPCLALMRVWETTCSGADLFLEADGGKSGWLCVVVVSELPELESLQLDCVSSLEFPSEGSVEEIQVCCRSPEGWMKSVKAWVKLTCEPS